MDFAPIDLTTLAYPERQLIVVESDAAVEEARRKSTEEKDLGSSTRVDWTPVVKAGASAGVAGLAGAAGVIAATELWAYRKRANRVHLPYLIVTASQAKDLRFPNGHPLRNVVYVGDPGVAGNYYPVANFHRVLFEGKVAEALRLLRSIGATEISIEYREGFDRGAGVDLSVAPPKGAGVEAGGSASHTTKTSSSAKFTMELPPSSSTKIPQDLIWYWSEPLWQEVANARLESGLRSFTLDVNYTDDFGINASLKAKIADVGLELGGKFTEYRETVWKLSGTFAEQAPQDTLAK